MSQFQTPRIKRILVENSLEIPPSPCLKNLGFGTGVRVLLYERSPRQGLTRSPWAVKKLNKTHNKGDIANRLDREAAILKDLKHPNIIGFRGYQKSGDGTKMLVVENGEASLFDIIEEIRETQLNQTNDGEIRLRPLPADKILRVIESIASALDYLHTVKCILHGDLKSANILVAGDYEAVKLCDFGVALTMNKDGIVDNPRSQYIGTEPWSALEAIQDDTITSKTDIFALGCVIFEMLALDTPHSDKLMDIDDDDDCDESYDDSAYQESIGHRPNLPEHLDILDDSYEPVLSLFYACTMDDPDKRPSAKLILENIKKVGNGA